MSRPTRYLNFTFLMLSSKTLDPGRILVFPVQAAAPNGQVDICANSAAEFGTNIEIRTITFNTENGDFSVTAAR
jgi:hypothetical protein